VKLNAAEVLISTAEMHCRLWTHNPPPKWYQRMLRLVLRQGDKAIWAEDWQRQFEHQIGEAQRSRSADIDSRNALQVVDYGIPLDTLKSTW
jgi:hypothetical protein